MNASCPVAIVFSAAGASMMNGSQRTPAKARTPCAEPPCSSSTTKATVSPLGVWHVPSCRPSPVGSENTQSNTSSSES